MVTAGRLILGAALITSIAAQTQDPAAESHRAKELMAAGRFEEAIPIYKRLVQAVPGNPGLILNLGLAEKMAGHPHAAIPQFEAVLKLQPDSVPARASLADAHLSLERFSEAAAQYRTLTALDASAPQAWYGLGKSYEGLAAQTFERLSKAAPQSPYVALLLAESRLQRKQYRSAFFFYHEAQSKLPNAPGLHAGLARLYRESGHADWAATELKAERAGAACTSDTPECRFRRGDYPGAAKLPAGQANPPTLFWATEAYNRLAEQAFDQLGKLPDSVEIHAVRAEILHGHGQDAEAAREWQAALALAPGDDGLQIELARAFVRARNYDAGMELLNKLLQRNPGTAELNFLMGESLWRTQQAEKALPYLVAALQAEPGMLPAHAAIGMVYALLNRPAEAVPHLEKAQSLDDDGSLHYSLARACQATGKTAQAQQAMRVYQQIKQRNQQVNDQLAKETEITAPQSR